jgi:hypothetical protein
MRTIALAHRKDVEPSHSARAFQHTLTGFLGGLGPAELGPDLEVVDVGASDTSGSPIPPAAMNIIHHDDHGQ